MSPRAEEPLGGRLTGDNLSQPLQTSPGHTISASAVATETGSTSEREALTPTEPHVPGAGTARLAEVLGWDHLPQLTPEQRRQADDKLAAAQAEARRVYGLSQDP